MVEHILTNNGNDILDRITLRKTDHDLSVHVIRSDSIDDKEKNIIEIEAASRNTPEKKYLTMCVGDEDLILFMRNLELFISRHCCKNIFSPEV
ncbi:MAG: hypothetical protein LBG17_00110 [Bacteroidales bacterium]|jgi:aspartate carbamoyltransferase regulatory subunit|nr:hypothetical protein [Bacteroidales bacterium]